LGGREKGWFEKTNSSVYPKKGPEKWGHGKKERMGGQKTLGKKRCRKTNGKTTRTFGGGGKAGKEV